MTILINTIIRLNVVSGLESEAMAAFMNRDYFYAGATKGTEVRLVKTDGSLSRTEINFVTKTFKLKKGYSCGFFSVSELMSSKTTERLAECGKGVLNLPHVAGNFDESDSFLVVARRAAW